MGKTYLSLKPQDLKDTQTPDSKNVKAIQPEKTKTIIKQCYETI